MQTYISLSNNKFIRYPFTNTSLGRGMHFITDKGNLSKIEPYTWVKTLDHDIYTIVYSEDTIKGIRSYTMVYLKHLLMGIYSPKPIGIEVYHINSNTTDYRLTNLIAISPTEWESRWDGALMCNKGNSYIDYNTGIEYGRRLLGTRIKVPVPIYTLLDIDDFNKLKHNSIHNSKGYPTVMIDKKHHVVSRYILGLMSFKDRLVVDHINNNPLDNRRSNLRIVTVGENNANMGKKGNNPTSQYIGVVKDKRTGHYNVSYKRKCIGTYIDDISAAKAYNTYLNTNNISPCVKRNDLSSVDKDYKYTQPLTRNQNKTSKYKNISFCQGYWIASKSIKGIQYYIGCHKEEDEAKKMLDTFIAYITLELVILPKNNIVSELSNSIYTTIRITVIYNPQGYVDCIFDTVYLPIVMSSTWYIDNRGYVITVDSNNKTHILHRILVKPGEGIPVHHINGMRSDNRRCNLFICSTQFNNANKTKSSNRHKEFDHVGVTKTRNGQFGAAIGYNNKTIWLGGTHKAHNIAAAVYNYGKEVLYSEFKEVLFFNKTPYVLSEEERVKIRDKINSHLKQYTISNVPS